MITAVTKKLKAFFVGASPKLSQPFCLAFSQSAVKKKQNKKHVVILWKMKNSSGALRHSARGLGVRYYGLKVHTKPPLALHNYWMPYGITMVIWTTTEPRNNITIRRTSDFFQKSEVKKIYVVSLHHLQIKSIEKSMTYFGYFKFCFINNASLW